ncbi:MAG: thiamine pyrophosphate-binding protein [Spirochaetaceae bacterium]|nr:thiamine pyrophosphate-binding protein [Spirochaetaceae bacterium]
MLKLSDYVFKFLKEKEIKHVFMLPGGGAMHLDDSLGISGIPYTCMLHEQAAGIAAEAYAQHTNTPGVLLVTSGPGATNAITPVTAGYIDSTPMIVISGQCKRADLVGNKGVRQIGSQEVNTVELVKPITKYAVEITEPNQIRYHMEKAWYEATTGRPGPVWISIPLDVQAVELDEHKLSGFHPISRPLPMIDGAVSKTIELLKTSKKPLFLAGNGIKLSGAQKFMYDILDTLQIPVQTTWKTIDLFDENDPLYVGHPGIMGDRGANFILQECDLLISVGSRLDTSITAFNDRNFAKKAKRIIVDIDPHEISRMDMDKEAVAACDAGYYLSELKKAIEQNLTALWDANIQIQRKKWIQDCKECRKKYPVITEAHRDTKDYVSTYYFIGELCSLLRDDDVIVPESSGGAGEITSQAWKIKKGQRMKHAAGLGSMGFGLPYAIGSCIANDKRRTILINGDGAFQLNIQELETLHQHHLPIKIFILNNTGYASIRATQRKNFQGRYVGSDPSSGLTIPNISEVAKAYGISSCRINSNDDLKRKLPTVLANDEMFLCELMTLPDEGCSPRVVAIAGPNGKITSAPLEKMTPLIDCEGMYASRYFD